MTHRYSADRVLPGLDATVIEAGSVVVEDERIVFAGPTAQLPEPWRQAPHTDFPGATLLPGLIEVHAHLGSFGDGTAPPPWDEPVRNEAREAIHHLANARRALSVGLTSVRNLGSDSYADAALRDAIAQGRVQGPRIVASGPTITTTGGHDWAHSTQVDSIKEIRHAVRLHHINGVDAIKVMATGGFGTAGSAPWFAQFSVKELRALVDEAHRLGKNTAAHAHGTQGIRRAVRAGVDTVEHGSFVNKEGRSVFDPRLADEIAEAGVYVDTTATRGIDVMVRRDPLFAPPVRQLYEHGVKLIAGTDAGIDLQPHHGYIESLAALAARGLPLAEILVAATSRAAEAIGLGGVTGQLTPGHSADLIAVRGNPLTEVAAYGRLELVVARGREFTPDPLPPLPPLPEGPWGPAVTLRAWRAAHGFHDQPTAQDDQETP
jgi:imidazolonepropionase-like amidohydrolase